MTVPRAMRILFAAVRLRVDGSAVAASERTVIAWADWPSGRKGILIGMVL